MELAPVHTLLVTETFGVDRGMFRGSWFPISMPSRCIAHISSVFVSFKDVLRIILEFMWFAPPDQITGKKTVILGKLARPIVILCS